VALEAGQKGEDIENVRKEIQFLRECDHPNVVAFYGAYYKDGALWVAMEYCGGGSVGDIGRQRRFKESEISVIMRGALQGLAYLHSKKKIHRDIKGGNILLTTDGRVKIADFGVSAQLRDTMSRRGTFVGTPYWMSPEMIQDSDYDYKSDIWSLGITAIELADQKPPLFDEHPMRVLIQIPRNPSPGLRNPFEWSSEFSEFLQSCLTKAPNDRPSAIDCLQHSFILQSKNIEFVYADGTIPILPIIPIVVKATEVLSDVAQSTSIAVQGESNNMFKDVSLDFKNNEISLQEGLQPCELIATKKIEDEISVQENGEAGENSLQEDIPEESELAEKLDCSINLEESLPVMSEQVYSPQVEIVVSGDILQEKLPTNLTTANVELLSEVIDEDIPEEIALLDENNNEEVISFEEQKLSSENEHVYNDLLNLSVDESFVLGAVDLNALIKEQNQDLDPIKPEFLLEAPMQDSPIPNNLTKQNDVIESATQELTSSNDVTSSVIFTSSPIASFSPGKNRVSGNAGRSWYNPLSEISSIRSSGNVMSSIKSNSQGANFIGGPFRVSHEVSVKFNSIDAKYEGTPKGIEWASIHQQFGIPLQQMRCRSHGDDGVPALLHMLRRELLMRDGVHSKYIYRINPDQRDVQNAKECINKGNFDSSQISDPHVFASLIKHWLRELPVCILKNFQPSDVHLLTSLAIENSSDRSLSLNCPFDQLDAQANKLLDLLPFQERAVFLWLLEHMLEVVDKSKVNMMTPQSLSIVFVPNLYPITHMAVNGERAPGDLFTVQANAMAAEIATMVRVFMMWKGKLISEPIAQVKRRNNNTADKLSQLGSMQMSANSISTSSSMKSLTSWMTHKEKRTQKERQCGPLLASIELSSKSKEADCHPSMSTSNQEIASAIAAASVFSETFNSHRSLSAMCEEAVENIMHTIFTEDKVSVFQLQHDRTALHSYFRRFQFRIFLLTRLYGKNREDREWGEEIIRKLQDSLDGCLTLTNIPASLLHLKRWFIAATGIDPFYQLVEKHQLVKDKLNRIRSKFKYLLHDTPESLETKKKTLSDPLMMEKMLQYPIKEPKKCLQEPQNDQNAHEIFEKRLEKVPLEAFEGIKQCYRFAFGTNSIHLNSEIVLNMIELAETDPAVGNFLVAIGRKSSDLPPSLQAQKTQLMGYFVSSASSISSELNNNSRLYS
jgi:serine/threonine kinase 3